VSTTRHRDAAVAPVALRAYLALRGLTLRRCALSDKAAKLLLAVVKVVCGGDSDDDADKVATLRAYTQALRPTSRRTAAAAGVAGRGRGIGTRIIVDADDNDAAANANVDDNGDSSNAFDGFVDGGSGVGGSGVGGSGVGGSGVGGSGNDVGGGSAVLDLADGGHAYLRTSAFVLERIAKLIAPPPPQRSCRLIVKKARSQQEFSRGAMSNPVGAIAARTLLSIITCFAFATKHSLCIPSFVSLMSSPVGAITSLRPVN
jgi:hypothetical protein